MKVDCVGIIEAGYAAAPTDEAWLAGVLAPFEPMTRGLGVMSGIVDFEEKGPRVGSWVPRGSVPDGLPASWRAMYGYLGQHFPETLRAILSPDPSVLCWSSERARLLPEAARPAVSAMFGNRPPFRDALGVLSAEPSGPSVLVVVPYAEEMAIPPRTQRQLRRATAHLCSAIRLRRRADGQPERGGLPPDVEAIMEPSGKVQHASGAAVGRNARQSLSGIVRRVERARGRLRHTDPEEALDIWLALFDGRWSVVERTESDGRRFLLARRNTLGECDPLALTQGERDVLACVVRGHSNKYTAYLLGVATSTAASRLESALRKLGLSSRREAIKVLAAAVPAA